MIAVVYSASNQSVVDGFNNLAEAEKTAAFWSDAAVAPVRKQIKDHYIDDQHRLCCYCRKEYPTGHNGVWDGEHIIPRAIAAKFMFEPRNLAASCKDCNGAKGDQEVRVDSTRVTFPDQSQHYLIVHPHFDAYAQHILWIDKFVSPRTKKGERLIAMCNLSRFALETIDADTTPLPQPIADVIGKFMNPKMTPEESDMYFGMFEGFVRAKSQKN